MLKNKTSKCTKERDKCAKGQASCTLKHSTIDHGITLRHMIERAWDKKEQVFCFFVDFRKAFDIVLRHKVWHIMEVLGVSRHLRAVVHRVYR